MNASQGTRLIAGQIAGLLRTVDAAAYARPIALFEGSTLGQHVRHIVDFYHCLLRGIDQGCVDYSARERDPLVERDPVEALRSLDEICRRVERLPETKPVEVQADFSADRREGRSRLQSTVGRELLFAYDHAVHHLAIIRIGIRADFPHLKVAEELGVAPATLKYREKTEERNSGRAQEPKEYPGSNI